MSIQTWARSRSRSELGIFGSLELAGTAWKKSEAGSAKKLVCSLALLEDKKHKESVLLLIFFW